MQEASDEGTISAGDTLIKMQAQTRAQQAAADAARSAAGTANSTLRNSTDQFRIEERPYITALVPQFVDHLPAVNQPVLVTVNFQNIGKTPAFEEISYARFVVRRGVFKGKNEIVSYIDSIFQDMATEAKKANRPDVLAYRQDIAPNAGSFITSELTNSLTAPGSARLSTDDLEKVHIGREAELFYGIFIRYKDSFGGSFETEYCWFYFGTDLTWHFCPTHNVIRAGQYDNQNNH
jgi:hypothetical protein